MKRILVTGVCSYVGSRVERYLHTFNRRHGEELYQVDMISLRQETWENHDFSVYDSIFHVAGIAHADTGKVTEEQKEKYYAVNRDLTYAVAKKAKEQGVKQFVFMSSVIVYGSTSVGKELRITEKTPMNPESAYGDSKVQAENLLSTLQDDRFQVAIVRSPMIYGEKCKGNFLLLEKIAKASPFFFDFPNCRSALYIENLAEFIRLLIESQMGGIFFPQNAEYFTTSQMVEEIGLAAGKKIRLVKWANPFIMMLGKIPGKISRIVSKAFGSLVIEQELSKRVIDGYQIYSLEESIRRIEKEQ